MPGLARLDAPGTLHHVIVRGLETRGIVDDRKDQENFVKRMEEGRRPELVGGGLIRPLSGWSHTVSYRRTKEGVLVMRGYWAVENS